MEYIHKKKAEKARSKMLQDQVKYIINYYLIRSDLNQILSGF